MYTHIPERCHCVNKCQLVILIPSIGKPLSKAQVCNLTPTWRYWSKQEPDCAQACGVESTKKGSQGQLSSLGRAWDMGWWEDPGLVLLLILGQTQPIRVKGEGVGDTWFDSQPPVSGPPSPPLAEAQSRCGWVSPHAMPHLYFFFLLLVQSLSILIFSASGDTGVPSLKSKPFSLYTEPRPQMGELRGGQSINS